MLERPWPLDEQQDEQLHNQETADPFEEIVEVRVFAPLFHFYFCLARAL